MKKNKKFVFWSIAIVILVTCIAMVLILLLTPRPAVSVSATIQLGPQLFHVAVAESRAQIEQGLSGRASMAPSEGMLFVFPSEDTYPFWMPDMHFPLDILWIRQNRIVEIAQLQPPSAEHPEPELHTPSQKADRVVELVAGTAERFNIRVGDRFSIVP